MFDMKQIGKKITALRKAHNMTQMELADKLDISFQAVSNWERGNTMPDISKLPELAEIFGISVDELLSSNSSLITSVIEGTVDSYIEEGNLTEEAVADALPLLKPDQAEELLEKANVSSFENLSIFLPYMDEDAIAELAMEGLDKGMDVNELVPYMDEDAVGKLALKAMEKGILLDDVYSYMNEEDVGKLAMMALENGNSVDEFISYMDEDDVGKLALKAIDKGIPTDEFLSYMNEDDVAKLADKALEKGEDVEIFLPYMDEDDVAKLAMKALRRR